MRVRLGLPSRGGSATQLCHVVSPAIGSLSVVLLASRRRGCRRRVARLRPLGWHWAGAGTLPLLAGALASRKCRAAELDARASDSQLQAPARCAAAGPRRLNVGACFGALGGRACVSADHFTRREEGPTTRAAHLARNAAWRGARAYMCIHGYAGAACSSARAYHASLGGLASLPGLVRTADCMLRVARCTVHGVCCWLQGDSPACRGSFALATAGRPSTGHCRCRCRPNPSPAVSAA
jgi:hypothetical protein